jgi:hypothetical protein
MPSSIAADLVDTRRILLARMNALETVIRKLARRVESLEGRHAVQTRPPETSSGAREDTRWRASGSQPTLDGMFHREDLEAWRD